MIDYDALFEQAAVMLRKYTDDKFVASAIGVRLEDVLILRGMKASAPTRFHPKPPGKSDQVPAIKGRLDLHSG